MRTNLLARRLRVLSQATAVCAVAGLATACSSDVSRLDSFMTASVSKTDNQRQIVGGGQPGLDAYAERHETSSDGIRVGSPQSTYGSGVRSSSVSPSTVTRSSLPPVGQQASAGPIVLQPRQAQSTPLRVSSTDPMTTNSIAGSGAPKPASGWDKTNGTWVTVRSGETLYNISRRYGVPVSAIMKANSISNGDAVSAGSRILIPTYQYSSAAPVSAPDNHPVTRASRASRGFQGQAQGTLTVPRTRSQNPAAQQPEQQPVAAEQCGRFQPVPLHSAKGRHPFRHCPAQRPFHGGAQDRQQYEYRCGAVGAALDDTGIRHSCDRQHSQNEWDCRWNQVDQAEARQHCRRGQANQHR